MSQTDRILPRYFLSRVRVSIRARIFYTPKNPEPVAARSPTMLQRHRPSEWHNLKGSLHLHARWRLTSQFTQNAASAMDGFVGAPAKPPQTKRESYPLCSDPVKRGSVCEAFEKKSLYRPLRVRVLACVMGLQYDNNISPSLLMIIIKIIIL